MQNDEIVQIYHCETCVTACKSGMPDSRCKWGFVKKCVQKFKNDVKKH